MKPLYVYGILWDYKDGEYNVTLTGSLESAELLGAEATAELLEELDEDGGQLYLDMTNEELDSSKRFQAAKDWREEHDWGRCEIAYVYIPKDEVEQIVKFINESAR